MRLHLVHDEKVINRTILLFEEAFPNENLFVVFKHNKKYKQITLIDKCIRYLDYEKIKNKYKIDSIIIHSLNKRKIDFIYKYNYSKHPIYWIIWGADLYNKLLSPKGYELFDINHPHTSKKNIGAVIKRIFDNYKKKKDARTVSSFVKENVNFLVTDTTDNDYDEFIKLYPEMQSIKHVDFFYYPIDEVLGKDLLKEKISGNNIQIAHSCSLTNNHLYAMNILNKHKIHNRKIIMPLSYSNHKHYKKRILKEGLKLFAQNFTPLQSFLPLDQYNHLQCSINVAIYGNFRQEAIGNILVSLYLGAKVFIARKSPLHEWGHRHNLKLFILEDMTQKDLDTPLSKEIQQKQRDILLSLYSKNRLIELLKNQF